MRLWVKNLPGGPDDVYEVFCDAPGWSASAGTFRVDAQGNAYVILTTAVKRGQYDKIRVVRREHLSSGETRRRRAGRELVLNQARVRAYTLDMTTDRSTRGRAALALAACGGDDNEPRRPRRPPPKRSAWRRDAEDRRRPRRREEVHRDRR